MCSEKDGGYSHAWHVLKDMHAEPQRVLVLHTDFAKYTGRSIREKGRTSIILLVAG